MGRSGGREERRAGKRALAALAWLALLTGFAPFTLGATPPAVAAATTAPIDFGALTEEVDVYAEASTVFAASRRVEKTAEAPASVTVVTRDEIRRYGWRTLAEVLRSVRGMHLSDDRSYAYLGVRGMLVPGDYNSRVLLTIDGHRFNDTVYDQALLGGDFPLDVDLLERVEVVRGPGSSLYGTSAMFGVVNVVTRRGRDLRGGEAAVSVGSFGTLERRVTYGLKDGRAEALVSLSGNDSDGRDFFFPELVAPGVDGLSPGCDGERWRHWLATGSAGRFSLQAYGSDHDKTLPGAPFATVLGSPGTRYQDRWTTVVARYDRAGESRTDVAASLAYHWYDFTGPYANDGYASQDEVRAAWWDMETQLSRQVHRRHRLIYGAEYRSNDHQDQGLVTFPPGDPSGDFQLHTQEDAWALYAQDEWRLRRNLILTAGLRRDRYENVGGSTNPRLALVHVPRDGTTWKLMFGTAFRAPNVYERFYQTGGNPDLTPERVRSLEASFERRLAPGTTLTLSAFDQHVADLMAFDDVAYQFQNLASADSRGLELELGRRRKDGHEQILSWSLQRATDGVTGATLPNAPRHLGRLRVGVPLAGPQTTAGLELLYVGSRLGQSRGAGLSPAEVGGYALANLNFSHRLRGDRFEVGLGVYNLLDRRHADPVSVSDFVQETMPGEGRAARLKVTWRF